MKPDNWDWKYKKDKFAKFKKGGFANMSESDKEEVRRLYKIDQENFNRLLIRIIEEKKRGEK